MGPSLPVPMIDAHRLATMKSCQQGQAMMQWKNWGISQSSSLQDSDDSDIENERVRCGPAYYVAACVVVLLAILSLAFGVRTVPLLLSRVENANFIAPASSPSRIAAAEFEDRFAMFAHGASTPIVLLLRTREGIDTVLTNEVAEWSQDFKKLAEHDPRSSVWTPQVTGYYLPADIIKLGAMDPFLKAMYVAEDHQAMVVAWVATTLPPGIDPNAFNETFTQWEEKLWDFIKERMRMVPPGFEVLLTGNPVTEYERSNDHSIELLLRAEIAIVPVALLVLAYLVKEIRLLVLSPIVLVVCFTTAATFVLPVTFFAHVSPDIPPAMLSVTIALSLDYTLFMLTRFRESYEQGLGIFENVEVLVVCTGHTIGVSGLLIAISFFGAVALPEENLQSAGMCLGLTTLACMLVSATLLPSLLLLLGPVLVRPCAPSARTGSPTGSARSMDSSGLHRSARHRRAAPKHTGWFQLMRCISRCPLFSVLLVLGIFFPILSYLPFLKSTADSYAVLPSDLPSITTLRTLSQHFPGGRFDPYAVVIHRAAWGPGPSVGKHGAKDLMMLQEPFDVVLELCDALERVAGVASIMGPTWLLNHRVDWQRSKLLKWSAPVPQRKVYWGVLKSHVNVTSVLLQLHTSFLPRGAGSASWVRTVRDVISMWEALHPGYTAWLAGGATLAADAEAEVMDAMPFYLLVSVSAIVVVVFLLFRSFLLPLRLAFALLFTLGVTFGIAVIVYQTPLLHGIYPWLANYNGLTYQVIPLATGVAVALGLDYDIFLISRIVEYRLLGLTDRVSIVNGVANTGGVISGAGLIMALAFSGMFFSNKLLHQQFALLLVTSVILDTFVVRTVLVPALMLSAGEWNWWPREMPEADADGFTSGGELIVSDGDQERGYESHTSGD